MGNLKETNKKIEKKVVGGYKKIEETVVEGYKKIENKFVDKFLRNDDETIEEFNVSKYVIINQLAKAKGLYYNLFN